MNKDDIENEIDERIMDINEWLLTLESGEIVGRWETEDILAIIQEAKLQTRLLIKKLKKADQKEYDKTIKKIELIIEKKY